MRNVLLPLICLVLVSGSSRAEDLGKKIDALANELAPQVVRWRRDLHAHPELSNREQRTSHVVAEALRAMGVEEIRTGVAGHGVVGLIRGGQTGPCVGLRADMDALPVEEQMGLPFSSQNRGVMHACGHDVHTSVLLGAAAVLARLRTELPGAVKLIFQPAEEGTPPGEKGGASEMVAQGVLERPSVAAIFGLHVNPELDTGKLSWRPGGIFAAVNRFRVTVIGRQSHAAMPWMGIDPVVAAAQVITALQTIPSRRIDARETVVVSVGVVKAGTAWNIIPGEVLLEGTVRTLDPKVQSRVAEEFRRIVNSTAAAYGARATIEFNDYTPAVVNDARLAEFARPTLARVVGSAGVIEARPTTGGEDFSCYAAKVPGLFFWLGVRGPDSPAGCGLHSPQFAPDEAALNVGVKAMASLASDYLLSQRKATSETQRR